MKVWRQCVKVIDTTCVSVSREEERCESSCKKQKQR